MRKDPNFQGFDSELKEKRHFSSEELLILYYEHKDFCKLFSDLGVYNSEKVIREVIRNYNKYKNFKFIAKANGTDDGKSLGQYAWELGVVSQMAKEKDLAGKQTADYLKRDTYNR